MLELNDLSEMAREDCLRHAQSLMSGNFRVEIADSDRAWDPIRLRHVFSQSMVVWRECGEVEVVLDEAGSVVGMVDESQLAGSAWLPLTPVDIRDIVAATDLFGEGFEVEDVQPNGDGLTLDATVRSSGRSTSERYRTFQARINPIKRSVISVLPAGEPGP